MPLKPAVSSAARRTIKSAFDELERTITPEDSLGFGSMTLEHVKKVSLEIEVQLAARQSLRNMRRLMPLFRGLQHYAKVLDILCNGTPYLPWIWAPITLILQISSEYVEAFEQIIKGYSRIAESLSRFEMLGRAFSSKLDFQQTLAVFYADILQFHGHAYKLVRRSSWKILFLTSWGRFQRQFNDVLDNMKRHGELIDLEANAHSITEARQMREDIKAWRDDSLAQVRQLNEKESSKQYESIMAWLKADEADQIAIFDALSAEGARHAGTCSWALKNPKVKLWLQEKPDLSALWIQGAPGSGKSVLACEIAKFMKNANMFLIQHFCSQRYSSSTMYDQILRSLLLQLLRDNDELVAHVYEDCVLGKQSPTVHALEKLLLKLLKIASNEPRKTRYIWILIDGLNECETRKQTNVVRLVNQITGKTPDRADTVCKVLIVSRKSAPITSRLRMHQTLSLYEERNSLKLAIRQYVSQRLQSDSLHQRLRGLCVGSKEIEDIGRVITNKADGMFLYARLVLDYLSKNIFYNYKEMNESIDDLPDELSDFYQKILTQVLVHLDPRSADRLKSIFGWIAFSKRPLKRMEFLSALTFASGNPKPQHLVPSYVLDICGSLVEERPDTTLNFIHISVKDFLQSKSSTFRITEKESVAEQCTSTVTCLLSGLSFLCCDLDDTTKLRVVKGIHGLHVYASEFWTEYLLHHASMGEFNPKSPLFGLTLDLAKKLDCFVDVAVLEGHSLDAHSTDDRLIFLKEQPLLLRHVMASLRARSLKRLESNIIHEAKGTFRSSSQGQQDNQSSEKQSCGNSSRTQDSDNISEKDGISVVLSYYQEAVRSLLQQDHCPGASVSDLELFKSQFRSSAFTCRLNYCPRATIGFVSEELRRQHEMAHTRLHACTFPDCKYPPLTSVQALKKHVNKYHEFRPTRRPIRPRMSTAGSSGNADDMSRTEHTTLKTQLSVQEQEIRASSEEVIKVQSEDIAHFKKTANTEVASTRVGDAAELGIDGQSVDSDAGEGIKLSVEQIGFRTCGISGCGQRLRGDQSSGKDDFHYWNWHHADSIARCADHGCQMLFSSREGLQAHYEQRHTVFRCYKCLSHDPEEFTLEDELRQHWRLFHLQKVKRWICVCEAQESTHVAVSLKFEGCTDCVHGKTYDRRYDAIKHLKAVHVDSEAELDQGPLFFSLLDIFVKEVWDYKVEEERASQERNEEHPRWDSDGSDEEKLIEPDDMFYVPELA